MTPITVIIMTLGVFIAKDDLTTHQFLAALGVIGVSGVVGSALESIGHAIDRHTSYLAERDRTDAENLDHISAITKGS